MSSSAIKMLAKIDRDGSDRGKLQFPFSSKTTPEVIDRLLDSLRIVLAADQSFREGRTVMP